MTAGNRTGRSTHSGRKNGDRWPHPTFQYCRGWAIAQLVEEEEESIYTGVLPSGFTPWLGWLRRMGQHLCVSIKAVAQAP